MLIGPLIRKGKPSRLTPIGLLIIAGVFVVYVALAFFCQGRMGCPSWLIVH